MQSFLSRIIGVLVLAVGLAGCSAIKLGYKTLPDMGYWWLDGYFDFGGEQASQAKASLARLHAWHRATELPRLAEMLERMERLAPEAIAPQQACAVVDEAYARVWAALEQAEPEIVPIAATLTPRQLRHLQRKYQDKNMAWQKEWIDLPPEEQRDKRYEQLLDRIEMIYGRLDTAQREVLRRAMDASAWDPRRVLAERQRRQQDLVQTLRAIAGKPAAPDEARALLHGYLQRTLQSPDPAYRAYQDAFRQEGCRTFSAMHQATTPAQREQAVRRLRAYQRDLRELAARP
ncbi:DUF6279 family lipoprotein [Ramlibacter sp.]|uniref:DUF6279 family lipoprotein n=1 Tax=Ramlibacter sp. TaxID=1917967 RepID=UPI0018227697|nr:DUF6279 family lipoprotein [Ramlibacter sp.]MBA2675920.1 hypothetical protein [Ramlibacter sp.]